MNDTSTVLQDKEELVREIDRFPIYFESGSLGSVSDKVTIEHGEKQAKITASLKEAFEDVAPLFDVAPDFSKSSEKQIQLLTSDLIKNPKNIYLLENLGNTYLSIGKLNEAVECFERALDINKDFRLAMASLAKSYMIQDRPDEALKVYLKYTRKFPNDAKAFIDLTHVYLRLKKLDEARAAIDKSISLRSSNPNAHHTLGILYMIQGNIDKSIAAFRRASSLDAHFAPAYTALGVCYAIKMSYEKSIKYLKIAYAMNPQGINTAKNLAQAYQNKGDFDTAATLIAEHLKKYPRDWEAQNKLAYSYFKLGHYNRSLECLQSLLGSSFETAAAKNRQAAILNNIGVVNLHMGLIPQAETMFRKSLAASDQPDTVTYFNLTRMLTDLGRREEAKKLVEEYITIAPNDNTPLILLAKNYMYEGAYEKSKEILDGILSKDPYSRDANILMGALNAEVFEDYDSAIEVLEKAIARNKSDQVIQNDLAYSYIRKGLIDAASDILGSVNWDKATFALYATKGLLQISKGDLKEGIRLYTMAISRAPNNEIKNMVRQKKGIEIARHAYIKGDVDKALRQLQNVFSIRTKIMVYLDQAKKLLQQIENSPRQSSFPFRETETKGDQQSS